MKLTQSAVSQMIQSLERSLGVDLFDRKVRPIALTPSGAVLLEKARALLLAARDAIKSVKEPCRRLLRSSIFASSKALPRTIGPGFAKSMQGLADLWSVHSGLPSQHTQALLAREADIVLTPDPMEEYPNIERHEILKELYFIALPADYEGEVESLSVLATERVLHPVQRPHHNGAPGGAASGAAQGGDQGPGGVRQRQCCFGHGYGRARLGRFSLLSVRSWGGLSGPRSGSCPCPARRFTAGFTRLPGKESLAIFPKRIAGAAMAAHPQIVARAISQDYPWIISRPAQFQAAAAPVPCQRRQ